MGWEEEMNKKLAEAQDFKKQFNELAEEKLKEFEFSDRVKGIAETVVKTLIEKNQSYGNSALDPVRVFSKSNATEQIKVRIDDKLSRIQNSDVDSFGEDTVLDLIGYLFLYKLALENDDDNA